MLILAALLCAALVFQACAGSFFKDYGRIRADASVTKAFESFEADNNKYRYYIFGSASRPDVIIGIAKNYELTGKTWKQVKATRAKMDSWLRLMEVNTDPSTGLFGSYIQDNQGQVVGVWYSAWKKATIKIIDGNKIAVSPNKTSSGGGGGGGGCG